MGTPSVLSLCFYCSSSSCPSLPRPAGTRNLRHYEPLLSLRVSMGGEKAAATSHHCRGTTRVLAARDSKEGNDEPAMFMDENGVVDDMDGYLNYVSPEYESVWDTKPTWCQPWTIMLTGVLLIASSWVILHSVLVTTIISLLICSWWYIFLYSYPKAYTEMIAERRKRVQNGAEDIFGWTKADVMD